MKIAIITQSYYPRPGGVTEHTYHTSQELRKRGHDVAILTTHFGSCSDSEYDATRLGRNVLVPHHGAWVNMTVGWKLGSKLKDALRAFDPDIVHTHCPLVPTLPLLAISATPPNAALVGTFHAAADRCPGYWFFRRALAKRVERINLRIAVSEAALRLAQHYFPGRYVLIPNGIDRHWFHPRIQPIERLRDGAFNILFVGRMDRRKGLKYLFRAVSIVARSSRRRIRFIVVGEDSPRKYLLPRIHPSVEVHFAGMVSRHMLPRYYRTGDLFCSPAIEKESFGIVLLEAMASGTPAVATAIPGYLSILRDRRNALVVPPRNPEALAQAILELIEDDLLRQKIRQTGLAFAQRYAWELVTAKIEQAYRETLLPSSTGLSKAKVVSKANVSL
jgi:phosphatidylinositol alpha-mannosyltransferase